MADRHIHPSSRSALTRRLVFLLFCFAALMPLPLGSNRPILWALWGSVIGVASTWCMLRSSADWTIAPRRERFLSACFAALALYMGLQILPFGTVFAAFPPPVSADVLIAAATVSLAPGETVLALIRWISYGLLFCLATQAAVSDRHARRLFAGLFWIVTFHAALGLLFLFALDDSLLGFPKVAYRGSATGGFVNRNTFATFLSMGAVIGISLLLERRLRPHGREDATSSRFDRYLGPGGVLHIMAGWLVIMATLVATGSRMGMAAGVAGMLLVFFLSLARAPPASMRGVFVLTLTLTMPAITLLLYLYGGSLLERLGHADHDLGVRLDLYRQVLGMIRLRPFLGFGGGSFETVYPLFHDLPVNTGVVWDKTHNTYLSNWVEYGVVFGSLPVVMCLTVAARLLKAHRRCSQPDRVVIGTLGAMTVAAVHSIADFSLEIEGVAAVFSILLGTGFAHATRIHSERHTAGESQPSS